MSTLDSSADSNRVVTKGKEEDILDVFRQMKSDGKPIASSSLFSSTLALLGLVCFVFPLWLVTIVPLTIGWQLIANIFLRNKESESIRAARQVLEDAAKDNFTVENIIPQKDRTYDLILIGSTGFTGKIAVKYLLQHYNKGTTKGEKVKWAIAGRSKDKLEQVKQSIYQGLIDAGVTSISKKDVDDIDVFVVDTLVRDQNLHDVVKNTRCIASTAGPFALYGSNVVEFCAKYGTHYVDITGEQEWSRQMIHKWQSTARQTGAKIVSFCGHDCIPWDLTVHKLKQKLMNEKDEELTDVIILDEYQGGGASGGTLATICMGLDGFKSPKYPGGDPWLVNGAGTINKNKNFISKLPFIPEKVTQSFTAFPSQTSYVGFFIMSLINAEVVKRSHILTSTTSKLVYKEGMRFTDLPSAMVGTLGFVMGFSLLLNPLTRYVIETKVLPPGKGPSVQVQEDAHLCLYATGTGSKGSTVESVMYFPQDGGYSETARMLMESGLCLALNNNNNNNDDDDNSGGFLTPATAMGDSLLDRLCDSGTLYRSVMK